MTLRLENEFEFHSNKNALLLIKTFVVALLFEHILQQYELNPIIPIYKPFGHHGIR